MKGRKIRIISAVLSLVFAFSVFTFVAAGCDAPQMSVYVITMFGGSDSHKTVFEKINAEFEESSGIAVENNSSGTNTTWQINVRHAFLLDSTTPDVLYYFNDTAADSVRNYLVPVDEIVAEYPDYGKDISVQINDEACLPFKGFTEGIIYRADEGYYSESDFADYAALKNKIISFKDVDDKRVSAGYDTPNYWINYLMALDLGAEEFAEFDGTKGFFDESPGRYDKWLNAVKYAVGELQDMGICTDIDNTENTAGGTAESAHFFNGNRGLLVDGSWQAGNMAASQHGGKMDVYGFPLKDGKDTPFILSGFTSGWFISKKAWENPEKRDAAVKYVMQHTSAESIDRYCQKAGGIPATGRPVTGASTAVNKFAGLLDGGVMSVVPMDDRMPDAAKSAFYSTSNGLPAILVGTTPTSVDDFFLAFYGQLNK